MSQHESGRDSASTSELISRLSDELKTLVRDEMRLAQIEVGSKAKRAGVGAGIIGAGGLLALYGLGVLIAAAVLALALVVDAWLAALIVAVVILVIAGIAALLGKKRVQEAGAPVPQATVESVKADVDAVRHARDH
ncbi:phage holin family protein [Aeromicrobium choanae]|uniref:Putative Holin-X, holin superfamily III n=1 Tax=Aeromicrobium choanae TaxID=1736691 RepID=A0A1T4Z8V9_9ACTN|nr:phage holin family protein [Aeromicrobium choanae]SKB10449.1 Putative Holin-X, holin superfamily III [Aeromicrobium choanae]